MALMNDICCSIWGCGKASQLGFATFHQPARNSRLMSTVNSKHGFENFCKSGCCRLRVLSPRALTPVEDDAKPVVAGVDEFSSNGHCVMLQLRQLKGLHNRLSKPLKANELSSRDGPKLRVAYKGLPGAYAEDAVLKTYPECETVPCEDFETAFKAVELWLVDKAVLPIESSVGGSVHRNYDLLLGHKLHIIGEVQLLISHCLLGLPGVRKEDLNAVMSHPQTLVQCKKILADLGVAKIGVDNTAAGAKEVVSNGSKSIGAIAGSRTENIYGLDIQAERIEDEDVNITRFLILARDPIIPRNDDKVYKTSIVFSLDEGPGVLFKALGVFALRNINLSKIESRPLKQKPLRVVEDLTIGGSVKYFEYFFYIDFEASMADPRAQYALEKLQEYTKFIRILGCYSVDKSNTFASSRI